MTDYLKPVKKWAVVDPNGNYRAFGEERDDATFAFFEMQNHTKPTSWLCYAKKGYELRLVTITSAEWLTREAFESDPDLLPDDGLVAIRYKAKEVHAACTVLGNSRTGHLDFVYEFLQGGGRYLSECVTHVLPIPTPQPPSGE